MVITRDFDHVTFPETQVRTLVAPLFLRSLRMGRLKPTPSYLSDYRAHLVDTEDHLTGIPTFQNDEDDDDEDEDITSEADASSVHWSYEEKARLFHALAVHSRWRLDLVAACVHTKSIVDVSLYVERLRDAAAALEAGTWKPEVDSEIETESGPGGEAEQAASELSSGIAATAAADRRRALPCAMTVSDLWIEREEAEAKLLAWVEPRWEAAAIRRARRAEEGNTEGETSRQEGWAREDMFTRLGTTHLRVMDALIRDSEDADVKKLSRKRKRKDDDDEETSEDEETANIDVDMPDVTALSPIARRRYYKRLYMRRKRAALSGEPVVQKFARLKPGRRFRPPPPKVRRRMGRPKKIGTSEGDAGGEGERLPEAHDRRPNVGGVTTTYRIKSEFHRLGVEGDVLRQDGYGLLHLGGLARAMRCVEYQSDVARITDGLAGRDLQVRYSSMPLPYGYSTPP